MNRRAALVAVVASSLGLYGPACKKKPEDTPAIDRVDTAPPLAEAMSPEARPITELLAEAQKRSKGFPIARMTIEYLGADGIMDPAYARLEVTFGQYESETETKPGDDPNRRTGAPVTNQPPPPKPSQCPRVTWRAGRWEPRSGFCQKRVLPPTCTPQLVWGKALVKGAPREAVARLVYDGTTARGGATSWRFEINDDTRGVHFSQTFADDCAGMVEAPDPTVPTDTPAAGSLDRQMIQNAIGAVKPKVLACATDGATGTVKVRVKVTPAGAAEVVTVVQTPTPALGDCVADALRSAQFPKTASGGSFSYPFVF